jgi:hypothetical protein
MVFEQQIGAALSLPSGLQRCAFCLLPAIPGIVPVHPDETPYLPFGTSLPPLYYLFGTSDSEEAKRYQRGSKEEDLWFITGFWGIHHGFWRTSSHF